MTLQWLLLVPFFLLWLGVYSVVISTPSYVCVKLSLNIIASSGDDLAKARFGVANKQRISKAPTWYLIDILKFLYISCWGYSYVSKPLQKFAL
jgi:hypothetical protein